MTRAWRDRPIVAGAAALAVVTAVARWRDALGAWQRPLWLDEVVTQLVANAPQGILSAMRSGVDFQPPPHYALVHLAAQLSGSATAMSARFPSVVAAACTVLLVGTLLRRTMSLPAALAGALVLAAHPLFVAQAFEARPYALWIMATAALAAALAIDGRWRLAAIAATAGAVVATHYFGVLSLAALGVAVVVHAQLVRRRTVGRTVRDVAPLTAGALVLLALLPLAKQQLAATGGRSWVPDTTGAGISSFLGFAWGWRPVLALLALGGIALGARRVPALAARLPHRLPTLTDPALLALLATALVPVAVVVVSVLYKPVLVLRYSAPAVLAVATLAALAVECQPRWARWALVALLLRPLAFTLGSTGAAGREETALVTSEARAIQKLGTLRIPVVAPMRHDAYRASMAHPGAGNVAWLELPDALLEDATSRAGLSRALLLVERDFGRAGWRAFNFPVVMDIDALRRERVVALLRDTDVARGDAIWLPGRVACPLSPRLVVYAEPAHPVECAPLQAGLQDALGRR